MDSMPINVAIQVWRKDNNQDPVVQSVASLTSSLVVKMLTVLVNTISNSQEFLLKKMWATHIFFSQNISIYVIFNDQILKDTLTNDIVSFEQLGHVGTVIVFYRDCLT